MSEAMDLPTQEVVEEVRDTGGFGGHPRGLGTLFFTEMWERFSYYGMRSILVLYMVALPAQGGLGFETKDATSIYGTYTMSVYLTALPGGLVADRWLGARLSVLLGGIIIACGHFTMVFPSTTALYAGMGLIAIGTGLLKPNISAMVGGLYFLEVVGEMCLSPVGLSMVTKLSPKWLVGIMMGVWFLASSLGSKLAGYLSGFFDAASPATLVRLYGGIALGLLVATGLLALLIPTLRRMMGSVR